MQQPSAQGRAVRGLGRKFRRNTLRKRLAGICQGMEDYTGVDAQLLRLVFLGSILFGGLGVFLYLVLWLVIPGIQRTPVPRTKGPLGQALRNLDQKVKALHRRLDPGLAQEAESALDALKVMSLGLDEGSGSPLDPHALVGEALVRLPPLVEQLAALSDRSANDPLIMPVAEELRHWQTRLSQSALRLMESRYARTSTAEAQNTQLARLDAQWIAEDLRLPERLDASQALLESIREKLTVLFKAMDSDHSETLGPKTRYHIEQIAFTHVPESLRAYRALPGEMTATIPLRNQKTADETLEAQLDLLDQTLGTYCRDLFQANARSLLTQGRFLDASFSDRTPP